MLFDAFSGLDNGIDIRFRTEGFVFNLRRLQAKTKGRTVIVNEFLFADFCAPNSVAEGNLIITDINREKGRDNPRK